MFVLSLVQGMKGFGEGGGVLTRSPALQDEAHESVQWLIKAESKGQTVKPAYLKVQRGNDGL